MMAIRLVLFGLPLRQEHGTSAEALARSGRQVACAELLAGFARSPLVTDIDALPCDAPAPVLEQRWAGHPAGDRIRVREPSDLRRELEHQKHVVLLSWTSSLELPMHWRSVCGAPSWPCVGIAHDLSSREVYRDLLIAALGGYSTRDAVVCSSEPAQAVAKNVFERVAQVTGRRSIPRLPLIPLSAPVLGQLPPRPQARAALGLGVKDFAFLHVGRFSRSHKADLLPFLIALARLQQARPGVRALLAGGVIGVEGEWSLQTYRHAADLLGLQGCVSFHPDVTFEDKARLLAAADAFVSPIDSLQESFGISLLEAMLARLPIIASELGGYRGVLDANCAILIETAFRADREAPGWWPVLDQADRARRLSRRITTDTDGLLSALLRLHDSEELRNRLAEAGAQRVKRFALENVIERHTELWEQLLGLEQPTESRESPFSYDHHEVFAPFFPERTLAAKPIRRQSLSEMEKRLLQLASFDEASTPQDALAKLGLLDPFIGGEYV